MSNQYALAGVQHLYGSASYTGSPCLQSTATAGALPVNSVSCPTGKCPGQVNGQDVCLACSDSAPAQKISNTIKTNSDGSKTVTTDTTSTTAAGSTTTTTVTNYSNTGTVNSGSNETKPTPDEPKTDCDKFPESAGCVQLGTPDGAAPKPSSLSAAFTPDTLTLPAGCPSPRTIAVFGHTYAVSYAPVCEAATDYVRPLLLLMAAVAAYLVFVGGLRS